MIAKNVGAIRARGEYLLFTNIDILFSDKIFKQLNEIDTKDQKTFYRAVRYDVNLNYKSSNNFNFLKKNVVKINFDNKTKIIGKSFLFYLNLYIKRKIRLLFNVKFYKFIFYCIVNSKIQEIIKILSITNIFSNACGDFQLINKKKFFQIGGYYEFQGYSWNLDTLLMWQAYFDGLKFKTLVEKYFT